MKFPLPPGRFQTRASEPDQRSRIEVIGGGGSGSVMGPQALRSRAYPIPPATQPVAFCRGQRLGAERGVQTGAKFTATTCSIHPARRGVAQPAEAEPVPLVA
jgi:hypothetical protein